MSIARVRNQVRVHYHEQPLTVLTPDTESINSSTKPKQSRTHSLDCIKDLCNLASAMFLFVTDTASLLQYPIPASSTNNKIISWKQAQPEKALFPGSPSARCGHVTKFNGTQMEMSGGNFWEP